MLAVYKDDQLNVGLGYGLNGSLSTLLPPGATYDLFQMSIYVQISDNDDGLTIFQITPPITVIPDNVKFQNMMTQLMSGDPTQVFNRNLNEGNNQIVIQDILTFMSVLNLQSLADKKGLAGSTSIKFLLFYKIL